MTHATEVPVLIVGGGAVGTVLSLELARRGIEFRCIDRMAGPADESRAIALHARTIELLQLVDPELAARILDHTVWCKGYVMHFANDGRRTDVRPGLDYTTIDSRYNGIASQSQSTTQSIIREYTASRFNKRVEYNVRFENLVQDSDGVVARVTHLDRNGEEELIRCRYLVAADGINSRVRRGLGLSVKGSDYKGSFFQNLDAHLHGFTDWTDHFHYCVARDHFLMVAPLPPPSPSGQQRDTGGVFRLLLSDRGEATDPSLEPRQAFTRILDQHFDGVSIGEVVWHSRWETWVRLADTFREGNVFLAGDSAHVHSTTGGQGMNCCMQDAFNLGWKLALVVSGHASPALLDSYERERRPVAEQVIWAASSLHDIFMTHGKDIAQRRQTMFEPGYQEKVVSYCSGVAYTYRQAVDAIDGGAGAGPTAGDRVPDVAVDGGTLFDRLRHPYFTLLVHDDDAAAASALATIDGRFGPVLRTERLPPSAALAERFGPAGDRMLLVRPDGYLAFITSSSTPQKLSAFLHHTLTA
jgi:2-polyprenyl-6-methoxyphenol hydroxylase-like FAD-dependent oxidoreductase